MKRALVLVLVAGCEPSNSVASDPFPIPIELPNGTVIAPVREGTGEVKTAAIDILSPLTLTDAPEGATPTRHQSDLTLLSSGLIARAHLDALVTRVHTCQAGGPCLAGDGAAPTTIQAVIGGDALAPAAARFDFSTGTLTLFSDIAGSGEARGRLCEAEFDNPFHGGGNFVFDQDPSGTPIPFEARRIAIGACLSYETGVPPTAITSRGADAELVLSTGIGTTILSKTAYQRWQAAVGQTCIDVDTLPAASEWLPFAAAPIAGHLASIDRLALVGRTDADRGPCKQVYAHHLLTEGNCAVGDPSCPCPSGSINCDVPAILELAPTAPIPVLVVDDNDPTLQALRTELRPLTAEVDGIVGTDVLAPTSIDVDAPNSRVLMRCEGPGCVARPELITSSQRPVVKSCLARATPDVDAGVPAPDAACP